MARTEFNFSGMIQFVGKRYKKASNDWIDKTGKKVEGKPERYELYFIYGEMDEQYMYTDAPIVLTTAVIPTVGATLTERKAYQATLRSLGERGLKVVAVKGVELMEIDEAPASTVEMPF